MVRDGKAVQDPSPHLQLVGVILRKASGRRNTSNVLLTRTFLLEMAGLFYSIFIGNQRPSLALCITQSHSSS